MATGNLNTDAVELLKQDHRAVESLFADFEATNKDERKVELAQKICMELTVHAQIEEELFYPEARRVLAEDQQDMISEATVEHGSLKRLIAAIDGSGPRDELFEANVKVLSEYVKHHVKEEENELMPAVRSTNADLGELGERLMERKQALKSHLESKVSGRRSTTKVQLPVMRARSPARKRGGKTATRRRAQPAARKTGSSARGSVHSSTAAKKTRGGRAATKSKRGAAARSRPAARKSRRG